MSDKVALLGVVGNEDGAHHAVALCLPALHDVGFSIADNAGACWVGEAVQGADYRDHHRTPEQTASAISAAAANAAHLARLLRADGYPAPARRRPWALTWDEGHEMAQDARFTAATGVKVYFWTPRHPGSVEATRTPTVCCASTCPASWTSAPSPRPTSTPSRTSSRNALDGPSGSSPPQVLPEVLRVPPTVHQLVHGRVGLAT